LSSNSQIDLTWPTTHNVSLASGGLFLVTVKPIFFLTFSLVNFGTPPQPIFVQLDTGSFELWVNPDCSILPDRDVRFCEAVGYYDAEASTTASNFSGNKTLRYGIGAANVTYIRDSIGLPGSRLKANPPFWGKALHHPFVRAPLTNKKATPS